MKWNFHKHYEFQSYKFKYYIDLKLFKTIFFVLFSIGRKTINIIHYFMQCKYSLINM